MGSDFLFAQPSFLSGMARLFDFAAAFDEYNRSLTPADADRRATRSDFIITGQDIAYAASQHECEQDRDQPNQPMIPGLVEAR
jgi:hypothetical protein